MCRMASGSLHSRKQCLARRAPISVPRLASIASMSELVFDSHCVRRRTHSSGDCYRVQTRLKIGADFVGYCGDSVGVTRLCAPVQLQLITAFARQYMKMEMRDGLSGPGPVRLNEVQSRRR